MSRVIVILGIWVLTAMQSVFAQDHGFFAMTQSQAINELKKYNAPYKVMFNNKVVVMPIEFGEMKIVYDNIYRYPVSIDFHYETPQGVTQQQLYESMIVSMLETEGLDDTWIIKVDHRSTTIGIKYEEAYGGFEGKIIVGKASQNTVLVSCLQYIK